MSYPALPHIGGNYNTVTFSGHSAGCQFSETMQIIHSSIIKGSVLMECGPYSEDLPDYHAKGVTTDELVARAEKVLDANAQSKVIDDPSHLSDAAIYLVGGTDDTTVPLLAVEGVDKLLT